MLGWEGTAVEMIGGVVEAVETGTVVGEVAVVSIEGLVVAWEAGESCLLGSATGTGVRARSFISTTTPSTFDGCLWGF